MKNSFHNRDNPYIMAEMKPKYFLQCSFILFLLITWHPHRGAEQALHQKIKNTFCECIKEQDVGGGEIYELKGIVA